MRFKLRSAWHSAALVLFAPLAPAMEIPPEFFGEFWEPTTVCFFTAGVEECGKGNNVLKIWKEGEEVFVTAQFMFASAEQCDYAGQATSFAKGILDTREKQGSCHVRFLRRKSAILMQVSTEGECQKLCQRGALNGTFIRKKQSSTRQSP